MCVFFSRLDEDLQRHAALRVLALREQLERVDAVLQAEAVRDELVDRGELAGREEREGLRVRVGVPEGAEDVDFARRGGGDGEHDVARAHSDEKDFPACGACLYERERERRGMCKYSNFRVFFFLFFF